MPSFSFAAASGPGLGALLLLLPLPPPLLPPLLLLLLLLGAAALGAGLPFCAAAAAAALAAASRACLARNLLPFLGETACAGNVVVGMEIEDGKTAQLLYLLWQTAVIVLMK